MGRTGLRFPELEQYTLAITEIIKAVNADETLNRQEKKIAIRVLEGITRKQMREATERHFDRPIGTDGKSTTPLSIDVNPNRGREKSNPTKKE